jgi:hypothetical protein
MVISTILLWIALLAGLYFHLFGFHWNNHSTLVLSSFILFLVVPLQTLFLLRNMRITFPPADTEQSTEKAKRGASTRAAESIDTLNEDERTQLLDWTLAQEEDRRRAR